MKKRLNARARLEVPYRKLVPPPRTEMIHYAR